MKTENFKVAGVTQYTKAFLTLGEKSDDYDLSNAEIKQEYGDGDRIFQYEFFPAKVELIPEPENEYDPNAVMVVVDGEKIGYIKKGNCTHVKNLLAQGDARVSVEIGGGKYKDVLEDDDRLTVERDEMPFWARVSITTGQEEPVPEAAATVVAPEPQTPEQPPKLKKGLLVFLRIVAVLLIAMSALLLIAEPIVGLIGIALWVFLIVKFRK